MGLSLFGGLAWFGLMGAFGQTPKEPPTKIPAPLPANNTPAGNRPGSPLPGLFPNVSGDAPAEMVEPCLNIPDGRVRLAPFTGLEKLPEFLLGETEYGTVRQDIEVTWREERKTITTLKPKIVEKRVQVMTHRLIPKGCVDPTTGEEVCEPRQVLVPVDTLVRCKILEPVTEEVVVRVPEVRHVESPVLVKRFGLLPGEKTVSATRYRPVFFGDAIGLPPCLPGAEGLVDPLGRPESPEGSTPSRGVSPRIPEIQTMPQPLPELPKQMVPLGIPKPPA